MSTTPTTNLNLIKNNADEPIANWRTNDNANMNALDTAIKAVQDATDTLEKARQNLNNLIGVLGKNSSNADLISKAQARANLDVAQSGGAAKTLYADEQTIAQNASLIASLRDSVSGIHQAFYSQISGNESKTFTMSSSFAVVFCSRNNGGKAFVALVDYWSEGATIIGTNTSGVTITKTAGTSSFTINNTVDALAVMVLT